MSDPRAGGFSAFVQPMYGLKIPDQTVPLRNMVELWLQSPSRMLMQLGIWGFGEDQYSYN